MKSVQNSCQDIVLKMEFISDLRDIDFSMLVDSDVKDMNMSSLSEDLRDLNLNPLSDIDDTDAKNVRDKTVEIDYENRGKCSSISVTIDDLLEWVTKLLDEDKKTLKSSGYDDTMKTEELFGVEPECSKSKDKEAENTTSACSLDDDVAMQDVYGSRNYGLPSSRPTMISAKYRQKEERRKVLKLSTNKLKRIEDPESSLRRSVLINNTVKRLQREAREEKSQRSQIASVSQNKCFGITSDFIAKQEENMKNDFANALSSRTADQLLDITNLPGASGGKTCSKFDADCLDCDEAISELTFAERSKARKRTIDETLEEECDVLSQFYLPPTPRMISPMDEDEDEDVNVVDVDTPPPEAKKRRGCEPDSLSCCLTAADRLRDNLPLPSPHFDEWSMDESILLQASAQTSQATSPFSCGHSSMLNEIVVYHNLIASLES